MCPQVTQKVPQLANGFLAGIPKTIDVKGLELNISLAGDPLVTPEALIVRDWGRFQNPNGESSGGPPKSVATDEYRDTTPTIIAPSHRLLFQMASCTFDGCTGHLI